MLSFIGVKVGIAANMPGDPTTCLGDASFQLRRLGARLREARVRRGLAAEELCALAQISRPTLRNLETGHQGVAIGALITVMGILGLTATLDAKPESGAVGQSVGAEPSVRRRRVRRKSPPIPASPSAGTRRPRSLTEVANLGRDRGRVDMFLREFLDEFYTESDAIKKNLMLVPEPPLNENRRENAYLAAVAEHLAMRNNLSIPAWVNGPDRFLRTPFFPAGLDSLKAICLLESPSAFRRRMIFVDADPLSRPRRKRAVDEKVAT
jgi:transcriptional regulator with XRE-family HTH domain